ncbi:ATP-dependent DNA helicase PIF1 [Elysia marginata]|uniref:ATP-dependent DNA helicase PIF1 n=1 Tax=Elysia marginata TaxID=1093978 RepID=A0AAV4H7P7_9GAST|nr:ATP-dependent DNA helicase PIF1 [Elysia marginata]
MTGGGVQRRVYVQDLTAARDSSSNYFTITANEAQGKTLNKIGIHLQQPFSYMDNMYRASSHVGSKNAVRIYAKDDSQHNGVSSTHVVYQKVIQA